MTLEYSKHENIHLCDDDHFNEAWLQDRICEDPSMIGLGAVEVLERDPRVYCRSMRHMPSAHALRRCRPTCICAGRLGDPH